MKNLLNLNGLYDSSPNQTGETQSRQNRTVVKPWSNRGQVVLTLLFFLTLGVGNVWGDTNINAGKRLYFFNGGEWNADIWLDIWNSSHDYKGLTQLGSTHYWYWQSTQWNNYYNFAFYKAGDRNGSCSSAIGGATIDKDYIFIPSSDWKNTYWIDDYKFVSPSGGVTIYFDNTDFGFSSDKIYFRSGFEQANEALKMSPVAGTANLYSLLLPNSYPFKIYTISESYGHTNLNSIYNVGTSGQDSHIAKQLVYTTPSNNFGSDFTFYYLSDGSYVTGESCQYYNYSTFSGHTRNVAITAPSHGTIQVSYTGENGYPYDFTSGNRNLAQTCNITVTATADRGYTFTSLTRNSVAFTSGSTYAIREDNTFAATFTPKSYTTVNLDNQGGTGSTTIGSTVTTGTAYPSVTKPVKDGYHFMGYYSGTNGTGTKYYNEDGTPAAGAWFVDANTDVATPTLYAYYATPTISATFSPASVLPLETVTVTPSFDHNPEGNSTLCYVLTTGSGAEMAVQPTFSPTGEDNAVSFEAPATPGTYSVDIRLFNANEHSCADRVTGLVNTYSHATSFTVEASNAVTVQYKCGNVELRPSTTIYATSNQTAATVTAPEIPGLTFSGWTLGSGVSTAGGTTTSSNPIQIHATGNSTLTANYSQSGYVYFKNTLGWDNVYLYKYNNIYYWDGGDGDNQGTGHHGNSNNWKNYCTSGPERMSLVPGTTDVYYLHPESGVPSSEQSFVFTNSPSEEDFFGSTAGTSIEIVRVNDNYDATNHMVVPENGTYETKYDGRAKYYTHYFFAPTLTNWGWNLRGNWDGIGESSWTNSAYWYDFTATTFGSLEFTAKRYCDKGNYNHYIQVYTDHTSSGGTGWGKGSAVIDGTTTTPTSLNSSDTPSRNITFKTTVPGEYLFTLTYGPSGDARGSLTNNIKLSVTYPVVVGDFRLVYTGGTNPHPGNVVKKRANGKDVVDMFVAAGQHDALKVQSCTAVSATSVTWKALASCSAPSYATGVNFETILSKGGAGVYSFTIEQDENGANPKITKVEKYTGRFYVRTNCVNSDKWNYKDSKDAHAMTYSEYSTTLTEKPFSHYYVKDVENGTNIRFTVATENSEAITDSILNGETSGVYKDTWGNESLTRKLNVRFTYNKSTNKIWRAYTEGPQINDYMVLRSNGSNVYKDNNGVKGIAKDTLKFVDMGNWVYQLDAWANIGAYAKLTAGMHTYSGGGTLTHQYLKGISGNGSDGTQWNEDDAVLLLGGDEAEPQHIRITYDFKTDRMITAWLPSETTIESPVTINADIILIRHHQEAGQSISFGEDGMLKEVNTVYGVMQFDKSYLNDVTKSRYSRNLYWISFPFDVKLSDVFGVGTYGQHWIIEYYDGKERAEKGYWADSPGFWKFVTPDMRDTYVLKANQGYVLALNLDKFGDGENGSTLSPVWANVSTVYLYFPSATKIGNLASVTSLDAPIDQDGYRCTIDRHSQAEKEAGTNTDINKNRTVADSYWHMIGAPSYANADRTTGLGTSDPTTWVSNNLLYVYEWNPTTNLYSVHSTSDMTFDAMRSYMVQYSGTSITWTNVTATPSTSVARRRQSAEDIHFAEFRLDLNRGEESQDHTFVRLSDDEETTANFDFNKDLMKEFNAGKANIYTVVDGYLPTAGNTLPLSTSRTTVVPVGVQIKSAGDYTFAMPEGTNGVGVTLLDNETGVRTSLSALDYTVNLEPGTYDSRFLLEISPVQNTPTDLGNVQGDNEQGTKVRKVLIDGILYIVKDGKLFDARGTLVR